MSGRAIGMNSATFVGLRVAGELTYIKAHFSNGRRISSKAIIPVYMNSNRGTDPRTGEKGRTDRFKLIAWGHLADVCCRSLPPGKAFDALARIQSYPGRDFDRNGNQKIDQAGQPIMSDKIAFVIYDIVFGEESAKMIAEEIATGRRPVNWDNPSHPDFQLWRQVLQARQQENWDGHSPNFGYARVIIPQGVQIDMGPETSTGFQGDYSEPRGVQPAPVQQFQAYQAPAPQYQAAPVQQYQAPAPQYQQAAPQYQQYQQTASAQQYQAPAPNLVSHGHFQTPGFQPMAPQTAQNVTPTQMVEQAVGMAPRQQAAGSVRF